MAFGSYGYGSGPYGTGLVFGVAPTVEFDLFCFEECTTMPSILSAGINSIIGQGSQFVLNYPDPPPPPNTTCDLGVLSGDAGDGGFPTDNAALYTVPTAGVGITWTLEWTVWFYSLPNDFSDLVSRHVFFGGSDDSGPVAGIFLSQAGIAYTGSVHHSGGTLVLDTPVQPLPDTSDLISTGRYITFRLAVDGGSGTVYLFVTDTDQIPLTGQKLVAVLPTIDAGDASFPPVDRAMLSVRGTTANPSRIGLDQWCMASTAIVPNLPPIAVVGADQAVRKCSVVQLDGSASFDPEGAPLTYDWRLIDGPASSEYVESADDGITYPEAIPTGFTNRLHSVTMANVHAVEEIQPGDVILIGEAAVDVAVTGTDVNGFFVQLSMEVPDNLTSASFKLLRQRGLNGSQTPNPTFFPDVVGFYRFDLTVNDGSVNSVAAISVINVVESVLPRGITPNLTFAFSYLTDFWNLVEDRDRISVYWSALAQVAASELYTLWQLEYAKSHRDIQRTFVRRWLHYDLVLGEPLPELTTVRSVYSGVTSSAMAAVGEVGINGTGLTISSPVFSETAVINLVGGDPFTAQDLADELNNRFQEIDSRLAATVITKVDTTQVVRITAPFPFTIETSSVPVLAAGSSNGTPQGVSGVRLGPRSYKVPVSLSGLGLLEDDLLVIDGQAYRIATVVSDALDDFPAQRVTVKSDIPLTASATWIISGYIRSELLDFYNGLVSYGDDVLLEVVDVTSIDSSIQATNLLVETIAFGASAGGVAQLPCDLTPVGGYLVTQGLSVRLARVVRRTYLPVDALVVDIPTLTEVIQLVDDTQTLRRNVDYYIEEYRGHNSIRFESGVTGGGDVWEGKVPPDRLWAEYTYLDNKPLIEEHFGIPAEFTLDQLAELPENVDYLSAVRGLWYTFFNGPTLFNLRVGAQILLGLPFAEETGVIEEIRVDFSPTQGRMLIRDTDRTEIVRSYTFPRDLKLEVNPATGEVYAVGDEVTQFAPLVEGAEVVDYIKDPKWFEGLLNQGIFFEVEKFEKFLVRVDSRIFSLPSLLFVRNFILKLKPRYTYPVFLVQFQADDTEVDVTDEISFEVTLRLADTPCGTFLSSTNYDDARSGGGGYWNQFDNQQGTSLPVFPTPDVPIDWGYDRFVLCPDSDVTAVLCVAFAGGPAVYDSVFAYDTPVTERLRTLDTGGGFAVPNGTTGLTLTPNGTATATFTSTLVRVRLLITGGPGADPDDYELVVSVNAVDQVTQAFTSQAGYTELLVAPSFAITAGDVIGVRIRHGGGVTRNPAWTDLETALDFEDGQWTFDDSLPAAFYCGTRVLA